MVWAQVAMAAVNVLEGYGKAKSQHKLAKAQYNLEEGRATNAALIRASENQLSMATANLDRYMQQKQNKKNMEAMENALHSDSFNYARQLDGLASNKMNERLMGASALGSLAAQAGAAGVGGASVDALADTERLRQLRVDQALDDQIKDAQIVHNQNQTAILDNGYASLDDSYIFAGLDYTPKDLVFDNSWQYEYKTRDLILGTGKAGQDAFNGFSGNMNNVGIDLSSIMGKSSGAKNQGLGKGAPISAAKGSTRL